MSLKIAIKAVLPFGGETVRLPAEHKNEGGALPSAVSVLIMHTPSGAIQKYLISLPSISDRRALARLEAPMRNIS